MLSLLLLMLLGGGGRAAHAAAPLTPQQARGWSLVSTGGSYGLVLVGRALDVPALQITGLTGALVGPSAGHLRAADWGHAALGVGVRSAAVVGLVASGLPFTEYCLISADQASVEYTWWEGGPCGKTGPEKLLGWGSITVSAGSTVYDLWDAGRAPGRTAARRGTVALSVQPRGLRLSGTF